MFPVLNDGDMQNIGRELSSTVKGVKFDSLIVERAIIGDACYKIRQSLQRPVYQPCKEEINTTAEKNIIQIGLTMKISDRKSKRNI